MGSYMTTLFTDPPNVTGFGKTDHNVTFCIAIYSHAVNVGGQCMSES